MAQTAGASDGTYRYARRRRSSPGLLSEAGGDRTSARERLGSRAGDRGPPPSRGYVPRRRVDLPAVRGRKFLTLSDETGANPPLFFDFRE